MSNEGRFLWLSSFSVRGAVCRCLQGTKTHGRLGSRPVWLERWRVSQRHATQLHHSAPLPPAHLAPPLAAYPIVRRALRRAPLPFFVGRMGGDTVAPTCHPRMPPGRACEQAPHSQERHPNLDLDPDPNLNGRVGVVLPSACLLLLALCLQWEASASGCPSWWKMRRRRRPCGRLSPARDQLPRDWALTTAVAATLAVVHGMASV